MPVPLFQIDFSQKKEYKIHCDQQIIHVEEYGHPHGIPAVFFHGGPGQGFSAKKAAYFNPKKYTSAGTNRIPPPIPTIPLKIPARKPISKSNSI